MEYDENLRQRLEQRLAAFRVQGSMPKAHNKLVRAAVALTIVEEAHGANLPGLPVHRRWSTKAAIVLTRRALNLRRHAGQWALPGGRVDGDETSAQAALRELSEEVGLHLLPEAILGQLDDFETRSGFLITPLVVWAGQANHLTPNQGEVRSVHRIPLSELLRSDAPLLETSDGSSTPVLRMPVGDTSIAAPTAAIMYQFREVCLHGRDTRVAHFDQPRFAWR